MVSTDRVEINRRVMLGKPVIRGTGDYIFLDLGPDAEQPGCLIVQRRDRDEPDSVAPSFRFWLEDFADKLEDDEFAYSDEQGCIMYADELDLVYPSG